MMNSPLGFWLPIFSAPLDIPHEQGRLIVDSSSIHTELNVVEIVQTPGYSDTMRLQRRLADREGVVHIAESWISAEDIWNMIGGRFVSAPDPEKIWWLSPEHFGELRVLVTDISLGCDSRQEMVFVAFWTDDNKTTHQSVRLARNKYFSAKLAMRVALRKNAKGNLEAGQIFAAFTDHGQTQELAADGSGFVDPESCEAEPPLRFNFPASTLYWHDGLRRTDSDEYGTHWYSCPRRPVCFRSTDVGPGVLTPNEGVYLKTD